MNDSKLEWWKRFQTFYSEFPEIELAVDLSRMNIDAPFFAQMEPQMQKAFADMAALEKGAIANPDENRMVGHYWLRAPKLAPKPEITREIEQTLARIKSFAADVHQGKIKPQKAAKFTNVLSIGIGGSALGPEFVHEALGNGAADKMTVHFFDNTDPDGMARVLNALAGRLDET